MLFEICAHCLVTLVYPGGEAADAGRRVCSLDRVDDMGALRDREIASEKRVVVDGALRFVREDSDGDAWEPSHERTDSAA